MAALHHLEVMVKDGLRFVREISEQYSLELKASRESSNVSQWVLASGNAAFLITQPKSSSFDPSNQENPGLHLQSQKFQHGVDTVFDVAVRVKDVDRILRNTVSVGGRVLQPKTTIVDSSGSCEIAVIQSCVGNVVHTLINRKNYEGAFLPGFQETKSAEDPSRTQSQHVKHIDHIALVCQRGNVDSVLKWYEDVFGFSRFFVNRSEEKDAGFVLDGDIGLRLKAMEYFQCAETMLSDNDNVNDADGLRLVIAESLPGHDAQTNQVESFIDEHEGPGIQHVGLYTDDIINTTALLRKRGVQLQVPPMMYYSHLDKLKEIECSGESLSLLRENGILLDGEADPEVATDGRKRYLKQVFTKPIFDKKTFLFELIERQGASGFGIGNITALWWSVQQFLNLPVSSQ